MKISQTVSNLQSGHKYMIVQCSKGNNSKLGKSELRFISFACYLIELLICVKFHQNI